MSTNDYSTKKAKHQNKIRKLLKEEPNLSRSQVITRFQYSYKWLSLYEKDWLDATLPRHYSPAGLWIDRDYIYYEKIHTAIHDILNNNILVRITTYALSIYINYPSLYTFINKMPKTKALIEKHSETYRDFNKRKLKSTVDQMKLNNENITSSLVLKKASVPTDKENYRYYNDFVKKMLDMDIE